MVFRANPKGGPIRYSTTARPEMGQQNIRITFDPSLDQDVEDLDKPKRTEGNKEK